MIVLQLKSSHNINDLRDIAAIIKQVKQKTGYHIRGHEVQQISKIFDNSTVKRRAERIIDFCKSNKIAYLTYHSIIFKNGENLWDEKWADRVQNSIIQTAQEADLVANSLALDGKVTIVVHLTSNVPLARLPISRSDKFDMLDRAEKAFLGIVNDIGYSNTCQFAVENTYPKHDNGFVSTGPFHPLELVRLEKFGIKTVLDISHYSLYANYLERGTGIPFGDLDREIYKKAPSWKECIKILSNSLVQLHVSDSKGYTEAGEGLPLGQGELSNIEEIFQDVDSLAKQQVQATLELGEGHLNSGRLQLDSAMWLIERLPHRILDRVD